MNLSLLLIIPLVASLIVLLARNNNQVRWFAFLGSLAQTVLCFYLTYVYIDTKNAGNTEAFLFQTKISWFQSMNIEYFLGVDGISIAMMLLTTLVVLAGILVSWKVEKMTKEFFFLLMFLSVGAYGFFLSLDLFMQFFFLEVAVIPKFLLIGIWGSGKKVYSATKLALMLMGGSALVFVALIGLYLNSDNGAGQHTFNLLQLAVHSIPIQTQMFLFPLMFVGFGVFTAIFPFHTWVPDGHSSAPTAASMFLAGISMKLGGYGCLRVATYLMPEAAHEYQWLIVLAASIAILYGAFATMMQTDLKYINAYSSISHCGFVLLGIGMLTKTAIVGAVMQMVSHGLMTALFFAAIGMLYERTHTRMVVQLGGLLKVMPFIGTVFFIAGLCSLGLPGFSGFVSEMTIFMGGWQNVDTFYRVATIAGCASIVVTAVYILRAVGKTVMGPISDPHFQHLTDATWNEKLAGGILIAGILVIGITPFWLMNLIDLPSEDIIQKLTSSIF